MITKYTFTKLCDSERLKQEIATSSIVTALDRIQTLNSPATTDVYFKDVLSSDDEATLNTIVTFHVNTPLPDNEVKKVSIDQFKLTSLRNIPMVSVYEPEGSGATIVSHNFCDKCSWYQGSATVTDETLTNTVDNVFSSAHTFWIDMTHGRVYDEDNILIATPSLKPVIKIDGVTKVEKQLNLTTDVLEGDYVINYEEGTVTFDEEVTGVVTASYHYADKSYFSVGPKAGNVLSVKTTEVQFTEDVVLGGYARPFMFEAWFVGHPIYGTMAVPGTQIAYKNAKDFISAANEGQGYIEPWAELTQKINVFPFKYARIKPLRASQYTQIRVSIKGDRPVSGEYSTVTFYVTVEPETT